MPPGMQLPFAPDRRECDMALGADEQPDAEFGLQRLDGLAERRLRHRQSLGGSTEMQLLRHGEEIAQLPQIHDLPPR